MRHLRFPKTLATLIGAVMLSCVIAVEIGSNHAFAADVKGAGQQVAPGLALPPMDPWRGKKLFASKGCVLCHSINKVGGTDAAALDASTMAPVMNPMDFAAKMWRGAVPMIAMQQDEIGHQIEFTGQDLADIVAFVHNGAVQKTFTTADIPPEIKKLMERDEDSDSTSHKPGTMGPGMTGHGNMMGQPKKKP